jgi:hypothetical protein
MLLRAALVSIASSLRAEPVPDYIAIASATSVAAEVQAARGMRVARGRVHERDDDDATVTREGSVPRPLPAGAVRPSVRAAPRGLPIEPSSRAGFTMTGMERLDLSHLPKGTPRIAGTEARACRGSKYRLPGDLPEDTVDFRVTGDHVP